MDSNSIVAVQKLHEWFGKADGWQKDLFSELWHGNDNVDKLIERAGKLIRQDYLSENHKLTADEQFPQGINFAGSPNVPTMLVSIADVKGVGALAPRNALCFEKGLTVVYGENGCGKSSYVRILKALENPSCSDTILGNVFEEKSPHAEAKVTFSVDGTEKVLSWNKASKIKCPIQVYDSIEADRFVNKENEVIYEPKVLSAITQMADIYARLYASFEREASEINKTIAPIPQELRDHAIISEFWKLATVRDCENFRKKCIWTSDLEVELAAITVAISESDSQKAIELKKAQKKIIQEYGYGILNITKLVDDSKCDLYLQKRMKQITTKAAADALISSSRDISLIDNFGSPKWKNMWKAANDYIREIEGESNEPVTAFGLCALCQQELNTEAKSRMKAFSNFSVSHAITEADNAHKAFEATVQELQEKIENNIHIASIQNTLVSMSISEDIRDLILSRYQAILNRCEWLLSYCDETTVPVPVIQCEANIITEFKAIVEKLDAEIKALQEIAIDRDKQVARRNNLLATQWSIANLPLKEQLIKMKAICSKCKTNALTSLKNDLSKLLITNAYIERFQNEMHLLDANGKIKVELVATAPKRGKTYHQVVLRGACAAGKHKNSEILSEGEFRVVSLASFLADLSSWNRTLPFVFDDPITSLDQKYEAKVASRLVQLSLERQVIVFTHRLAFAQLLDAANDDFNAKALQAGTTLAAIAHTELRSSPLGQPTEPNYVKYMAMEKAINLLLTSEVSSIRKAQDAGDYHIVDGLIHSVCASFRNIIEYGVEQTLLSGVVSRFGRNVSTLKLPRLYAITADDIGIFDEMMTKYSYFDHSHSSELPVPLPSIDEVIADLTKTRDWAKDFKKRSEAEANKAKGKPS